MLQKRTLNKRLIKNIFILCSNTAHFTAKFEKLCAYASFWHTALLPLYHNFKFKNMKDYFEKMSAERCTDWEFVNTMDVANVFTDNDALDAGNLFVSRFRRIPNWFQLASINCEKANEWLIQNYQDSIADCFYTKRNHNHNKIRKHKESISVPFNCPNNTYLDDVYYFLFDDLLVYLNHNQSEAKFLYRKTDNALVDRIVSEISKFKKKERSRKKPEIQLLVTTPHGGLSTTIMNISKPKFSIENNYNDDFLPVHETILSRLRKKTDKGLVLLHGKPGTGKTSYIRYLITKTQKPIIFLPPNMAASITDPGLMNVLIDNPNSVFVIEDAENIIIDRNRSEEHHV